MTPETGTTCTSRTRVLPPGRKSALQSTMLGLVKTTAVKLKTASETDKSRRFFRPRHSLSASICLLMQCS